MPTQAKVFRIELHGGKDVNKDIVALKNVITAMGAAIKTAKIELGQLLATKGDPVGITNLKNKLADLEKQLAATVKQYKNTQNEAIREAQAQKLLSQALIDQAKVRQASANAIKAEENARRAKAGADKAEEAQTRRQQQANMALAGSYNDVRNQLAKLRPLIQGGVAGGVINFNGQNINFEQAIAEFKRLSFAEQDFRRQFAKDGTIVGEYAKGIVNAFGRLGIDDIIRNQVIGAKKEISSLEAKTRELVVAYRAAQQSGGADMNKLEKEIHDNVVETQKLSKAMLAAEVQLKGIGGIGTQITNSLNQNFRNLKNSIGQFVLGYVGFQAVMSGIQKTFSETIALDSLAQSLKAVSGSEQELAINQQFLAATAERLGLVFTDSAVAFKNFYAASTQAGISADGTREIFESAASASANLKLSQEQTNGVLLAFGQIASKGKVQAEELRGQIGERIPGAFSIAARAIGVTQAELNKMLEQGQVISSEFLPKFAAELKKTFGVEAGKRVEGLQASVNRLKNQFTALIQENQQGLTTFFGLLVDALGLLIKAFPVIIAALGLYAIAQLRAYLITKATTEGTKLNIFWTYAQTVATRTATIATNLWARATALLNLVLKRTPLGLVLTGVGLLATAIFGLSKAYGKANAEVSESGKKMAEAARAQKQFAQQQEEASSNVIESIASTRAQIDLLVNTIKDESVSLDVRKKAYEELVRIAPEFNGLLKDEQFNIQGLIAIYDVYIKRLNDVARAKAFQKLNEENITSQLKAEEARFKAQSKLADAQAKLKAKEPSKAKTAEERGLEQFGDISTITGLRADVGDAQAGFDAANALVTEVERFRKDIIERLGKDIVADKKKLSTLNKDTIEAKELAIKLDSEQQQLNAYLGIGDPVIKTNVPATKTGKTKVDKLSAELKNRFKDIDAVRDQELANEALFFENKIETEKQYLGFVRDINIGAINAKLKLLDGSNAEERKQIAEFNLEKIKINQDTNKKLFDIDNKALEIELRNRNIQAQNQLDLENQNPEISEAGKLKAKEDFLNQSLIDQVVFNANQIALEKKYAVESIENEQKRKEAIEKLRQELIENAKLLPAAQIKDIQAEGAAKATLSDRRTAIATTDILSSGESQIKQAKLLRELGNRAAKERLQIEVDTAAQILKAKEDFYAAGLIAESEYQQAITDYRTKEAALLKVTVNEQITAFDKLVLAMKGVKDAFLESVLGIKQYTNDAAGEAQKMDDLISDVSNNIKEAMTTAFNQFFQNETDRIERSKEQQLDFLDREKERVLAQAQSEDEKATIERKFAKLRKEEEKKAFEEKKKLAKKQATIDFALGAIKSFAQFGWPLGLIAVAGLALAYAAQIASINSQTFAMGGKVQPLSSGKVNISPNMRTRANGDNVLATVRTGEVILNQRQQAALGGHRTFKSLGVPGFASGGQLGTSLKAPAFSANNFNGINTAASQGSQDMAELKDMVRQVTGAVYASDRKQVILNPNQVTDAQRKKQRDISVATI